MLRSEEIGARIAIGVAASAFAVAGTLARRPRPSRSPIATRAPIEVVTPAPFVELALPAPVYARAAQPDLRDLRVVDAAGERVPFALLDPTAAAAPEERRRDALLFPLPTRPAGNAAWPSPVEVTVDGDRIAVRRSAAAARTATAPGESPGWLFDLGELRPAEPAPRRLRPALVRSGRVHGRPMRSRPAPTCAAGAARRAVR